MNKKFTIALVDAGILLVLLALSFGIWFYPWSTLLILAPLLLGGTLFGQRRVDFLLYQGVSEVLVRFSV